MLHRRRNASGDDEIQILRRRVASGDDEAVFALALELNRRGMHDRGLFERIREEVRSEITILVQTAHAEGADQARSEIRDRERHQGSANYETFLVQIGIENDRVADGVTRRTVRMFWDAAPEANRVSDDNSFSLVTLEAMEWLQNQFEERAPEDIESAGWGSGGPSLPRGVLNDLYRSFISSAMGRVDWREIAATYVKREIPESGPEGGTTE